MQTKLLLNYDCLSVCRMTLLMSTSPLKRWTANSSSMPKTTYLLMVLNSAESRLITCVRFRKKQAELEQQNNIRLEYVKEKKLRV